MPDAQTLQNIADEFDVSVQKLLGVAEETEISQNSIVDQLAHINEELAISNRRSAKIWKTIALILLVLIGFLIGREYTERKNYVDPVSAQLPENITVSGVGFNGDSSIISCSFVPSIGNEEIVYKVTFFSKNSSFPSATVTAQYNNGVCSATFNRKQLTEYGEYTIVLNMDYHGDVRNLTLADNFQFQINGYSWTPKWE